MESGVGWVRYSGANARSIRILSRVCRVRVSEGCVDVACSAKEGEGEGKKERKIGATVIPSEKSVESELT